MTKIEKILIMAERIYLHLGVRISINLTLNFMCGCFKHHFIYKRWKQSWGGKCALVPLCVFPFRVCRGSSRAVSAYLNCRDARCQLETQPWELTLQTWQQTPQGSKFLNFFLLCFISFFLNQQIMSGTIKLFLNKSSLCGSPSSIFPISLLALLFLCRLPPPYSSPLSCPMCPVPTSHLPHHWGSTFAASITAFVSSGFFCLCFRCLCCRR